MNQKFFVTTPIYYVNDAPHIGHTCTTVAADILARYHKLYGDEVFFLTGTDEHGAKVAQEAEKAGLAPQAFTDKVSQTFAQIWPKLNIQYDYFIRTTNPEHKKIVQEVIQKIYDQGDIYKDKYEGLYCLGCEKFLAESDLVNGRCPLHPHLEAQRQSEINYFFKLSKYVPVLIKAIEDGKDPNHYQISPAAKREEILSKLKAGNIPDLSISRASVKWGIPIPWDPTQTIYVWFDALLNYYSALKINHQEDFWPANLHLVAKDILWFHTVIWEAMLMAAELPVPKEVFVHSFYLIDGQKMSKSLGNVITPGQLLTKFGADATRYLIASSFPRNNDNDVSWEKFREKYNADLANGLGNLVARVAKLAEQTENLGQFASRDFKDLINNDGPYSHYQKSLDALDFGDTLITVWGKIHSVDIQIDTHKPWEKENTDKVKILQSLIPTILEIAVLLQPFMPQTAETIIKQFTAKKITFQKPLFPRL